MLHAFQSLAVCYDARRMTVPTKAADIRGMIKQQMSRSGRWSAIATAH
jgi:hypothetical protein